MRVTVDRPADLHHIVTPITAQTRRSMNQTMADLTRLGLGLPGSADGADGAAAADAVRVSKFTRLPVIRLVCAVTAEDVRALESAWCR